MCRVSLIITCFMLTLMLIHSFSEVEAEDVTPPAAQTAAPVAQTPEEKAKAEKEDKAPFEDYKVRVAPPEAVKQQFSPSDSSNTGSSNSPTAY